MDSSRQSNGSGFIVMDSIHSCRFFISISRSIDLTETYQMVYRSNFSEEKKLTIRSLEYLAGHSQLLYSRVNLVGLVHCAGSGCLALSLPPQ